MRKSCCRVKTVLGKVSARKKNRCVFFLVQSVCAIFRAKKNVCKNVLCKGFSVAKVLCKNAYVPLFMWSVYKSVSVHKPLCVRIPARKNCSV